MEDFFRQFRMNWERRPTPVFEESDWQNLEKRLNAQGKRRRNFIPVWWWVFPLLLLSLGANLYFVGEINNSRRTVLIPEPARDTVYMTEVVFKTDTIYKTRVLHLNKPAFFEEVGFSTNILQNHHDHPNLKTANLRFENTTTPDITHSIKNSKTIDSQIFITKGENTPAPAVHYSTHVEKIIRFFKMINPGFKTGPFQILLRPKQTACSPKNIKKGCKIIGIISGLATFCSA